MARRTRNTVVLFKIQTAAGVDAAPTGAANAMQVFDFAVPEIAYNNVSTAFARGYMGAAEHLPGTRFASTSFSIELAASGTAGTAPAYAALLRVCGLAETVTASTCVEYTPISTALEFGTLHYFDDGLLHKLLDCVGNVEIVKEEGGAAKLRFSLIGVPGGIVAQSNATPTLTAFKRPFVVTDINSGDITFGCTYASGALTGGTAYPSRGLTVNLGNQLQQVPILGGQTVDIADREITGSTQLELTAAQEVTIRDAVDAITMQSLGFTHGLGAGKRVTVYGANVQCVDPKSVSFNGRAHLQVGLRFVPTAANNDFRLAFY